MSLFQQCSLPQNGKRGDPTIATFWCPASWAASPHHWCAPPGPTATAVWEALNLSGYLQHCRPMKWPISQLLSLQAAPRLVVPYPQAAYVLPAADSHSVPHLQAWLWNDDWHGKDCSSATSSSTERVHSHPHRLHQRPVQMNCRDTVLARTDGHGAGQTSTAHGCLPSRKETTQKDWLKKDNRTLWSCNTPWCDYSSLSQLCGCPALISERLQWYFVVLNLLWDRQKHKTVRASSSPANCACRLVAICCPQRNKNLSQNPLTRCFLPHRAFLTPHLSLFRRMCHSWHIAPPASAEHVNSKHIPFKASNSLPEQQAQVLSIELSQQ